MTLRLVHVTGGRLVGVPWCWTRFCFKGIVYNCPQWT